MGCWTKIDGYVSIYKKHKVSIKEVVEEIFTDESFVIIDTKDCGDHYHHKFCVNMEIDGDTFVNKRKEFFEALEPIKGTLDIVCELRFIS